MHLFVLWCGFVGAWLLVAGAIYQAFLELRNDQMAEGRMAALTAAVPLLPRVSPWWWLLPPVRLVLDTRRRNRIRETFLTSLSSLDRETLVTFISKARGWVIVATGGLLIAMEATYSLIEHLGYGTLCYWLAVMGSLALCVLNTILYRATLERSLRPDEDAET